MHFVIPTSPNHRNCLFGLSSHLKCIWHRPGHWLHSVMEYLAQTGSLVAQHDGVFGTDWVFGCTVWGVFGTDWSLGAQYDGVFGTDWDHWLHSVMEYLAQTGIIGCTVWWSIWHRLVIGCTVWGVFDTDWSLGVQCEEYLAQTGHWVHSVMEYLVQTGHWVHSMMEYLVQTGSLGAQCEGVFGSDWVIGCTVRWSI